jgi:hypothetical protein
LTIAGIRLGDSLSSRKRWHGKAVAGTKTARLDAKTRELIALAVGVTPQCDGCGRLPSRRPFQGLLTPRPSPLLSAPIAAELELQLKQNEQASLVDLLARWTVCGYWYCSQ